MKHKYLMISMISLALFVMLAVALRFGQQLVRIGTAYKAKMLCSEVFVAGRRPQEVLADMEIDDLEALGVITASVEIQARATTANFFGRITQTAKYRGNTGCALVFNGKSQTASNDAIPMVSHQDSSDVGLLNQPELPSTAHNPQLAAVIDEAFSEPDPAHLRRTRAVVVVHNGQVVAERYAPGFGPHTRLLGWSMTKSVLNALVGILVKDGKLSLDTTVSIPEWHARDDPRGAITLNHLLHMSSGLEFDEDLSNPLADVTRMLFTEPDMALFALRKSLQAEPGTQWQYSSGTSNIISRVIRKAIDDKEYRNFPRHAFFNRIGMPSAILEADASGTFVASSYMYATAQEWANFGILYLQDGMWKGERILPEGWVQYTRISAPADPEAVYGSHFWLRIPQEYRKEKNVLPDDAFHAVGHEAQFVTILPSHNMVIVRLGKTRYPQGWKHDVFVNHVLEALSQDR